MYIHKPIFSHILHCTSDILHSASHIPYHTSHYSNPKFHILHFWILRSNSQFLICSFPIIFIYLLRAIFYNFFYMTMWEKSVLSAKWSILHASLVKQIEPIVFALKKINYGQIKNKKIRTLNYILWWIQRCRKNVKNEYLQKITPYF